MKKLFLAALVSQAGFAQACEAPNAELIPNSVFLTCQSNSAPGDVDLTVAAAEFCAELGVAIEDKLGKTVSFSDDA